MLPHDPTPVEAPPLLRLHDPEEIFEYYDGPILFTVRDEPGDLHLASFADEERTADGGRWTVPP